MPLTFTLNIAVFHTISSPIGTFLFFQRYKELSLLTKFLVSWPISLLAKCTTVPKSNQKERKIDFKFENMKTKIKIVLFSKKLQSLKFSVTQSIITCKLYNYRRYVHVVTCSPVFFVLFLQLNSDVILHLNTHSQLLVNEFHSYTCKV